MADSVQYALDRMVADLEDLRQRGIFSQAEVRAIAAKRREFEYLLRRREARRLDFIRYAEHELRLESLRALRAKRLEGAPFRSKKQRKSNAGKGGASAAGAESDYMCMRLVRSILNRAVTKFPSDVDLWLQYIEFAAQQGQTKMLGKLFARALQLHPRNDGLWIKAASWEFFDAGNSSSARSLMQRGLRINPGAKNLWLQYFRLEFCYVEKVTGRREVLGLDELNDGNSDGDKGTGDRDAQRGGAMVIPALEGEGDGERAGAPSFKAVKKATAAAAAPVMNDTARRFYRGAVPSAVFRAAIKAVPHDVGFRGEFLRCCAADFPGLSDEVASFILSSIAKDFPESCEAWELRAVYPVLLVEGQGNGSAGEDGSVEEREALREGVEVFELAVQALGTREPDMWVRYAAFLRDRLEALQDRGRRKRVGETPAAASDLVVRMHGVLARAVEKHVNVDAVPAVTEEGGDDEMERRVGDARESLSAGLADVCIALGKSEEALAVLRSGTWCLPRRSALWLRRAALERRLDSLKRVDMVGVSSIASVGKSGHIPPPAKTFNKSGVMDAYGGDAVETLREGLKFVSPKAPGYPDLWRELLSSLVTAGAGKTKVAAAFRQAVTACDPSGADPGNAQGEFIQRYLRWSGAMEGLEAARAALEWARRSFLLAGTGAVGAYKQAIELELVFDSRDAKAVDEDGKNRVRELYEEATTKFGKKVPQLWEDYALFETQQGEVKLASAVRWRAEQQTRSSHYS